MLPNWWPRSSCVYCGARVPGDRASAIRSLTRRFAPPGVACRDHRDIVRADPHFGV